MGRNRTPGLAGSLHLKVDVAVDGTVLGVKNAGAKVADVQFVTCVASVFYGLKFAATEGVPSVMEVQLLLPSS